MCDNPTSRSTARRPAPTRPGRPRFLDEEGVPYEFKDVDESPELNEYIAGLNRGKRVIPTIQVENDFLINPDNPMSSARAIRGRPRPTDGVLRPAGAQGV